MQYGNYVVMQMRPIDVNYGFAYTQSEHTLYGIFRIDPYKVDEDDIDFTKGNPESAYKVNLVPVDISLTTFPNRAWYADILNNCYCIKEFEGGDAMFKARKFCIIQNDRLIKLREIFINPKKHIYFKDKDGNRHQFFYDKDKQAFYEKENGIAVTSQDCIIYASMTEMEHIMFYDIDIIDGRKMPVKYNSWKDAVKHFLHIKY